MVRHSARNHYRPVGPVPTSVPLRLLHVVVQAGPTNSQWNEHCLPAADDRQLSVCSLLPATVEPDPRITRFEGDGTGRGAFAVLRRALREGEYDVVHVHAPASAAALVLACAMERRGWSDVVFTLHNSWGNIRPRNRILAGVAMVVFPSVVACSRSAARSVPALLHSLVRPGIDVVPNGVDTDRIDRVLLGSPRRGTEATARPADRLTVVTVGRLIPIKDQASLLTAFAHIAGPDDQLVIVGEGPLREALTRQARELGIAGRVHMPGLLPRDEVYRTLGGADLFVSPSYGEGLPLSVLEAMAAGLPTVLSDIAPHREIVEQTQVADLVPAGDVAALTVAMARLRDMDRTELDLLGARSRQVVLDGFSLRSMAEGYQVVYSKLSARAVRTTEEVA